MADCPAPFPGSTAPGAEVALAPVVPISAASSQRSAKKAKDQSACLRIRPWRATGRRTCLSDLDCDPDRLCVDSECI